MDHNYYPEQEPLSKEVESWVGLLIDHARFMRNGFNTTEEQLFEEADQFSQELETFTYKSVINIDRNSDYLCSLKTEVQDFIDFKRHVAREIANCRTLSILPASLIDHIMREAIFFYGILARITNDTRPTWRDLGLPGRRVASTAPQALIPELDRELDDITWEELIFWLDINYEHGVVLSLYFRPEQRSLRNKTLQWSRRIERLSNNVLQTFESSMTNPKCFIEPAREIIKEWTNFLRDLYKQLTNCTIPGKQMNVWPRVVDHMIREAVYFLQVLNILGRMY